eukprot:gnl/Chilomastix_cuspidata/815.p1 GENE.gnl/Chilomastix_cuspidata/815~~gnl/Chilomastix_cuspidata/815.p1  ORF type:complete len:407 (+),score=146.10 gnl/Chilomastix_cuspidata/815:109-1221(+)
MGIVGLPNVGKSMTFNFLSKTQAPSENFMFCTIDPNNARVAIEDERFDWLCDTYKPKSRVPTYLEVIDIAGLVKGASEGAGRGNAFLSHIQAVDGIFHLVRVFDDLAVPHCEGDVDPGRDMRIINEELAAKDIGIVRQQLATVEKIVRNGIDRKRAPEIPVLEKLEAHLASGTAVRHGKWDVTEIPVINDLHLYTAKPMVYLLNMSEASYVRQRSRRLKAAVQWIQANSPGDPIIPFSAPLESRLVTLSPEQRAAELERLGATSQLTRIVNTGYNSIHLIHFFTCGADEVRCWTIREGTEAADAGAVIHSDFRDFFISVDTIHFDDLREAGSERRVREAGKVMQAGRTYVVRDGDVLHFRHCARGGRKKH